MIIERKRVSSIDPGDSQINQREHLLNRDDEFERGNGKRRKQKRGGGGICFNLLFFCKARTIMDREVEGCFSL